MQVEDSQTVNTATKFELGYSIPSVHVTYWCELAVASDFFD